MFDIRHSRGASLFARLMLGTTLSVIAIAAARAQAGADNNTETVVVTGTSIRGTPPVGANLITVDRATIESTGAQTVQQLLSTVPQINTFGGSGQGGSNSDFTGGFAPAIHSIGGGSSSATLVLINGHRFPTQGLTEANADPTVIPASALERVEVLPDGASSIYGSDAVAGVVNFITRKDFTGLEINAQSGIASNYSNFTASALVGHSWNSGSVLAAYDYTSQSNLMNSARDFATARQDIRRGAADPSLFTGIASAPPAGSMTTTPAAGPGTTGPYNIAIPYPSTGVNYQTFNCPVATIAASSTAPAFYYQPGGGYGGQGYSTSTTNVPSQGACDFVNALSLLPSTVRNSGIVQLRQEITHDIVFDMELVYGSRASTARSSRGVVNAQVFGPASLNTTQINPFYVGNATTGNSTEYIRYDFNSLLGPGAYTKTFDQNAFAAMGLTWNLGDDQEITLSGVAGTNFNYQHISGVVSQGEALLALNGTTSSNGDATGSYNSEPDPFGLGTTYPGRRTLTSLNALDVWDPVATNKTSAAVRSSLLNGGSFSNSNQELQDFVAKFDGSVFDVLAGPVKVAIGAEFMHQTMDEYGTNVTAAGGASANTAAYYYREGRTVYAAFVELNVPLVSPQMNVPLVTSLALDVSGRWDRYSDFGDTKNPKIGFNWVLTDGLKVRGSFATSFVAPGIHDHQAFNSQSQINALNANPGNPIIPFVGAPPYNGGAGTAGTWVATPTDCAAGHGTVVNSAGGSLAAPYTGAFGCKITFAATSGATTSAAITVPGGNAGLKPAIGRTWSGGFDLDVGRFVNALDGLLINLTYFDVAYKGLITNQQTITNIPQLTYFAPPGGWAPTSPYIQNFIAGRPVTIPLQSQIWATFDGRLQNAYNLWENGIDFSVNYNLPTDGMGDFHFGLNGSQLLRYNQQGAGLGNPILDNVDGKNSPRYNSQDLTGRADFGWSFAGLSTDIAVNYIHPYAIDITNFPYNLPGPGRGYMKGSPAVFTSGGTGHIGAVTTVDLLTSYALPKNWLGLPDMVTSGSSISLQITNLADANPPFNPVFNPLANNNITFGNPIGRLVTVGFHKTF